MSPNREFRQAAPLAALIVLGTGVLAGCAHRFNVEGVLLKSAVDRREITVSHEPIPGFMDAMVMPFKVRKPDLLPALNPGERIRFRLVVTRSGSFAEGVQVLSPARPDAGLLRSPAVPVLTPIGGGVPDFTLVDGFGKRLALSDLRGQVVLVSFIYTRCPLPDYCPLQMANFKQVKAQLGDRVGREVTLLTITFDPRYDTPEVMARYGNGYGADGKGWSLLTGTPQEIQHVTEIFGLEFWPEEGLITHTLQTAVIDRDGRLYATLDGKDYTVDQLVDVVNAALVR
jgi:protein SCO1/2